MKSASSKNIPLVISDPFYNIYAWGIKVIEAVGSGLPVLGAAGDDQIDFEIYQTGHIALYNKSQFQEHLIEHTDYDKDVIMANVMAHESLFHNIGGFSDPVGKFFFDKSRTSPNFDEPNLTLRTIQFLGLPSQKLLKRLIKKLELQ